MYQRIVLAILFSIFMFCLNSMLAQDEWRKIYNGKDMDGWEQTGVGHFTVEPDGTLKTHDGLGCLIYTKEKFGNIRLRVSYKLEAPLMNGGVNFRIPNAHPKDAWEVANTGHEVQIWGREDDLHCTGSIYSFSKTLAHPYSETDWNEMEIWIIGPRTEVWINHVKVNDYEEGTPLDPGRRKRDPTPGPRPNVGYIGLQNHGDINNVKQFVYYKDIMVAPLAGY